MHNFFRRSQDPVGSIFLNALSHWLSWSQLRFTKIPLRIGKIRILLVLCNSTSRILTMRSWAIESVTSQRRVCPVEFKLDRSYKPLNSHCSEPTSLPLDRAFSRPTFDSHSSLGLRYLLLTLPTSLDDDCHYLQTHSRWIICLVCISFLREVCTKKMLASQLLFSLTLFVLCIVRSHASDDAG